MPIFGTALQMASFQWHSRCHCLRHFFFELDSPLQHSYFYAVLSLPWVERSLFLRTFFGSAARTLSWWRANRLARQAPAPGSKAHPRSTPTLKRNDLHQNKTQNGWPAPPMSSLNTGDSRLRGSKDPLRKSQSRNSKSQREAVRLLLLRISRNVMLQTRCIFCLAIQLAQIIKTRQQERLTLRQETSIIPPVPGVSSKPIGKRLSQLL